MQVDPRIRQSEQNYAKSYQKYKFKFWRVGNVKKVIILPKYDCQLLHIYNANWKKCQAKIVQNCWSTSTHDIFLWRKATLTRLVLHWVLYACSTTTVLTILMLMEDLTCSNVFNDTHRINESITFKIWFSWSETEMEKWICLSKVEDQKYILHKIDVT